LADDQECIASILDAFDAVVSDLFSGLPAGPRPASSNANTAMIACSPSGKPHDAG